MEVVTVVEPIFSPQVWVEGSKNNKYSDEAISTTAKIKAQHAFLWCILDHFLYGPYQEGKYTCEREEIKRSTR